MNSLLVEARRASSSGHVGELIDAPDLKSIETKDAGDRHARFQSVYAATAVPTRAAP